MSRATGARQRISVAIARSPAASSLKDSSLGAVNAGQVAMRPFVAWATEIGPCRSDSSAFVIDPANKTLQRQESVVRQTGLNTAGHPQINNSLDASRCENVA